MENAGNAKALGSYRRDHHAKRQGAGRGLSNSGNSSEESTKTTMTRRGTSKSARWHDGPEGCTLPMEECQCVNKALAMKFVKMLKEKGYCSADWEPHNEDDESIPFNMRNMWPMGNDMVDFLAALNSSAPSVKGETQNIASLKAHGYKMVVGYGDEGNVVVAWLKKPSDKIGFAMCPEAGDTLPYVVNLEEWGFKAADARMKEARQKIDDAHAEFYVVWNDHRDKLPAVAINHLEAGMKILADLLTPAKTSKEEAKG